MIRACVKSVRQILQGQFQCFIMEHACFPLINNPVKDMTSMPSDKLAQRSTEKKSGGHFVSDLKPLRLVFIWNKYIILIIAINLNIPRLF